MIARSRVANDELDSHQIIQIGGVDELQPDRSRRLVPSFAVSFLDCWLGQPAHKPMLVYTRSAMLEVLGTQVEVEAERAATTLNVSEDKVRVKRFSDGSTVDVPARHRLIAAADRDMLPSPVPHSVNH